MRLIADRFAQEDTASDGRAIDLATGRAATLVTGSAGGISDQARWSVRCDVLQRLHHRGVATLVDFGIVGECSRFEAWSCGPEWTGLRDRGRVVAEHACTFFGANGLSCSAASQIRVSAGRAVALPDASSGYPAPVTSSDSSTVDAYGLTAIVRPAVATLAEMFRVAHTPRPQIASLRGPRGSGRGAVVLELARIARLHGFVPVAASLVDDVAQICRERSLFIIGDESSGWPRLLRVSTGLAQPHVLLMVASEEIRGIEGVALARIDPDALAAAVTPMSKSPAVAALVRRAARQSKGLPGHFAQLLWPIREEVRPAASKGLSARRAAERVAVYGQDGDAESGAAPPSPVVVAGAWPVPGELTGLRKRMDAAIADLDRGRHAPGIRQLRQSIGGLARRFDWTNAASGSLHLAGSLLRRGRPRDAHTALDASRDYADRAGDASARIDVAMVTGVAWTDLARLDEAESVLTAAVGAARAEGDLSRVAAANRALARCQFWRGDYADAEDTLGPVDGERAGSAIVRHATLAARIAVGQRDVGRAMSLVATATDRVGDGRPDDRAAAACAAAFVHLAINDFDAVHRDVAEAIAASRLVHDPLRALRARLLLVEAERRRGRAGTASTQLQRLKRLAAAAPPIVRSRWDLLAAIISGADPTDAVRRQKAVYGLGALDLLLPLNAGDARDRSDAAADDMVAIVRACQTAEDEGVVLKDVCVRVRQQLHAASVAFVAVQSQRSDLIASDGERSRLCDAGTIAVRAADAGIVIAPHRRQDSTEAAAPVQYAGATIGALCARWAIGSTHDPSRAAGILATAAAAAAPIVSAALLRRRAHAPAPLTDLLGVTPAMVELRAAIERAAAAPFAVLITGESGSGKELVARAVHRLGARRERPFCTLNCAALPDDLVESELFGHSRGSFTGAVADRPGVFEAAHGGTLFLDEIGELSLRAQAKILRVIQEGELRRVGENISRRVDVRIVAATNRDLQQEVGAGRFRLDLLYRLDVVRLAVAPLRDRREDIAVIAEHVWHEATTRIASRAALSASAIAALARYDWPGNVRELQNVLAALAVRSPKRGVVPPTALPPAFGVHRYEETWRLEAARRTFEERFVRAALVRSGGHRGRAAFELGVSRQGLTKLMTRLGIEA